MRLIFLGRFTARTITLVVSDVPDQVLRPTVPAQGDEGTVTIGFQAPASNGKPITGYEVVSNPSVPTPTNCSPPSCTIRFTNRVCEVLFTRVLDRVWLDVEEVVRLGSELISSNPQNTLYDPRTWSVDPLLPAPSMMARSPGYCRTTTGAPAVPRTVLVKAPR